MPIATADRLRLMLADPIRRTAQYLHSDGTATAFFLSGAPVYSGTAPTVRLVVAGGVLSATGGTAWDYQNGILAFGTALSAQSAVLVDYHWSVFSEVEVETLTALQSDLNGAAMLGIEWLQADYARRLKWALAQGPSVDPTQAAEHLAKLWAQYRLRVRGEHVDGGLESWAEWAQEGVAGTDWLRD